tara:strand:- start:382 stop:552 length:171 start_codon:yes stop_codon:yes gene_type:complete
MPGQEIILEHDGEKIVIKRIDNNHLGISASRATTIHRAEVYERRAKEFGGTSAAKS